jgi:hypothetical protein
MTTASLLALGALHAQDTAAPAQDSGTDTGMDAPALDSGTDSDMDGPQSPSQITPPTTPGENEDLDQTLYGDDQALADAQAEPVAQSRPWKLNLHASVDSRYDDNIFISSSGKQSDYITRLSAGGGLTLGDYTARLDNYLISDYTGIGEIFARHGGQDAYEQSASLIAQMLFGHLTVKGDLEFQDLADEDIDSGARARRQIYAGDFSARYDISDKTYLEATAQINIADYTLYLDSNDEHGGLSFNYLPDPDLTIGIGAMGGILNVQDATSQTYEQLLASASLAATGKFTIDASAGGEARQLSDGGNLLTPVFQLTGDYKPSDGLDLNITGFRKVLNSAFYTGADYIATGVSAGISYRISDRFSAQLNGGWEHTGYRNVATGASISRTDNYFFVNPTLRYTVSTYCHVDLYYLYRKNDSTYNTSSFNDAQAGFSLNFTY